MTRTVSRRLVASVACLTLWPLSLLAAAPDSGANLSACRSGRSSCDPAQLTPAELDTVARADHARNVAACRRGLDACDTSGLTEAETVALAVAGHDRNVSSCTDGIGDCDLSRLTAAEAQDVAASSRRRDISRCTSGIGPCDTSQLDESERAEVALALRRRMVSDCRQARGLRSLEADGAGSTGCHPRGAAAQSLGLPVRLGRLRPLPARSARAGQVDGAASARNLSECEAGRAGCDYALLSPSEAASLAATETSRNYTACREGRGYCDRSRLTPVQASAIPEPPGLTPEGEHTP